jgi:hypothetical protein
VVALGAIPIAGTSDGGRSSAWLRKVGLAGQCLGGVASAGSFSESARITVKKFCDYRAPFLIHTPILPAADKASGILTAIGCGKAAKRLSAPNVWPIP